MKRKATIAIICIVLVCALAGCQLAREDMGTYGDKLIGIFVTQEYLDLFDFESYLNDNLSGFSGGEIVMDGDTAKYQGRFYATLTSKTLTNEETGEITEMMDYVFEGVEGIAFFSATIPPIEGRDSFITSASDPAISDPHMSVHIGDDGKSTVLEGTIYVSPTGKSTFYTNSVYQSADGSVYLTSGNGIEIGSALDSEGLSMSTTIDATTTETEDGKSKTDSTSVTLSVSVMFAPEKIVVLEMGEDSGVLSRREYAPGEMPERITPRPGTAYVVVETHKRDATGGIITARALYGKETESFRTYAAREDGICVAHGTNILWR